MIYPKKLFCVNKRFDGWHFGKSCCHSVSQLFLGEFWKKSIFLKWNGHSAPAHGRRRVRGKEPWRRCRAIFPLPLVQNCPTSLSSIKSSQFKYTLMFSPYQGAVSGVNERRVWELKRARNKERNELIDSRKEIRKEINQRREGIECLSQRNKEGN